MGGLDNGWDPRIRRNWLRILSDGMGGVVMEHHVYYSQMLRLFFFSQLL